jgi:hypothetical protein
MQSKVSHEQSAPPRVYVGIGVCKDLLDGHVRPIGRLFHVPIRARGRAPPGELGETIQHRLEGPPCVLSCARLNL